MKPYVVALTVLMLLFSCSRQPVRVAATMPDGPTPSENLPPADKPNGAEDRPANAGRAQSENVVAPEDGPVAATPRKGDPRAAPEVKVTKPATETNETADIEHQGSLGSLPLSEDTKVTEPDDLPLVSMTKSACYGPCPIYTLSWLPSGTATLSVVKGLMGPGEYRSELDEYELEDLNNSLDTLQQMELADLYPVDKALPTDIQWTSLVLPDEGNGSRTLKIYFDAPAPLQLFMEQLEDLVDAKIWKKLPAPRR